MRALLTLLVIVVLVAIVGIFTGYIHVGQHGALTAPTVRVEGGSVPTFNVSTPDVHVGTKAKTVDVPTVGTKQKTVDVPTVSVKKPGE